MTSQVFDIHWSPVTHHKMVDATTDHVDVAPRMTINLGSLQMNDMLDFGSVAVDSSSTGYVTVSNPFETPVMVALDRFNGMKHGFQVTGSSWDILPNESCDIQIVWNPTSAGGVRTSLNISYVSPENSRRIRTAAFLTGVATADENGKSRMETSRKKPSLQTNNSLKIEKEPLRPIENSMNKQPKRKPAKTLSLVQPVEMNLEKSRKQKVLAKEMKRNLYDEKWMEKQEAGFTVWLNYVINPDGNEEEAEMNANHPLAQLARKQRKAAIARQAYSIFHSEEIEEIKFAIEREISCGGLSIREDRNIYKDLGLRKLFVDMLQNYNTIWLRLGLETVLGIEIPLKTVKRVIISNILSDPELVETFKDTKRGLFDENPEYRSQMSKLTLRRFLLLVLFLDRAKIASVIDHPSCLFSSTSSMKSSRELLIGFAKEYLSGEGNVLRHLQNSCRYHVYHEQTVLDEFDFRVQNIAVDLRDGVRLTRAVEVLANNKSRSLSNKLRVPAVSRLQKLHNAGLALTELQDQGIDMKTQVKFRAHIKSDVMEVITNKDIVDGHRQKTLSLLWKMVAKWKISYIVPINDLKDEIQQILAIHGKTASAIYENAQAYATTTFSEDEDLDNNSTIVQALLLQWCQVICAHHGMRVCNFTTSMASGMAICLLIHHYHPKLLPREAIAKTVVQYCDGKVDTDLDWMAFDASRMSRGEYTHALHNERANFAIVNENCSALGCVPVLLPAFDSENIPEAKMMLLFLSYLSARLLNSRNEIRAASLIQKFWIRKRLALRFADFNQAEHHAKIVRVQSFARGILARQKLSRARSALIRFQAISRGFMDRQMFLSCREMVVVVQSVIRRHIAETAFHEKLRKIRLVQQYVKSHIAYQRFKAKQHSAMKIQSVYRGFVQQRAYAKMQCSAIVIQSNVRRIQAMNSFDESRFSATVLQAWFRMQSAKSYLEMCRNSASRIQSSFRGFEIRSQYLYIRENVIILQRFWKSTQSKMLESAENHGATKLQSLWRMHVARTHFENIRNVIVTCQRLTRKLLQERQLERCERAVTKLSAWYRGASVQHQYSHFRVSAIRIQAFARGVLAQKVFDSKLCATLVMQAAVRGYMQRRIYIAQKRAIVQFQANMRRQIVSKHYQYIREQVVIIQRAMRAVFAQHELYEARQGATRLQAWWRAHTSRTAFQNTRAAAIVLQTYVRGYCARVSYQNKLFSAVQIQSMVRSCRERAHFLTVKQSTTKLQAWSRTLPVQSSFRKTKAAVVVLQSVARMVTAVRAYENQQLASIIAQSEIRRHLAQSKFQVLKRASCRIQNWYKTQHAASKFQEARCSAIRLQAFVRASLIRSMFLSCREDVITIQSVVRRKIAMDEFRETLLATLRIQDFARKYCLKGFSCTMGAVKFQALFRGFMTRKHSSKPMLAIRKRLLIINSNTTEDHRLGNRTKSALDWILSSKNLAHILEACNTLKVSTRISRECRVSVLESNATQVLFKLMKSCNRSEPHQKVLEAALDVLVQTSPQDADTNYNRLFLVPEQCGIILVDLLQIFRDKMPIFSKTLTIFDLFCWSAIRKQKVILADHDICKRLVSIEDILRKKNQLSSHSQSNTAPARSKLAQRLLDERQQYLRLKSILSFLHHHQ